MDTANIPEHTHL